MLDLKNYPTDYFSPVYQQIVSSFHADAGNVEKNFRSTLVILEGTEKLIKEELVRCIWFGQHIKKDKLYTDDGLRLEILSPGRWNSEGGPDFRHAEILLEGRGLVKGDIEIHVFASDWTKHQHNKQETYNLVCLHVVMWNDIEEKGIYNVTGQCIPQLTLSEYLNTDLDDIADIIDIESYLKGGKVNPGHCQAEIENQAVEEQWIGLFLDYAGDDRILRKAKRYEEWIEKSPFEQVLYKALMEALGYKENKEPFLTLATRMPQENIRCIIPEDIPVQEKKLYVQSLLLGTAGLLPQQRDLKKLYDKETSAYIHTIEQIWETVQPRINQTPMIKGDWTYAGIRPANFPERRIAAIANIISGCSSSGIFRHILSVFQKFLSFNGQTPEDCNKDRTPIDALVNNIQSLFLETHDPYWSYHYVLGGKRLQKPQKLLGKERTSNIFINVIIPILIIYARRHNDMGLEKILHLAYRSYAPLPATGVIKFMEGRILGQSRISKKVINSVRRQQGLYQIFKDFCENDNVSCNKCALYLSLVKG